MGLTSTLHIELFQGDTRQDVLTGDTIFVPQRQEVPFQMYFDPEERGTYRAEASVAFGPYTSNSLSTVFQVGTLSLGLVGGVLALIIVLVGGIMWRFHIRRKSAALPPNS